MEPAKVFPMVFILSFLSTTSSSRHDTDTLALLAFKDGVRDPSGALGSWNDRHDVCNWTGVWCTGPAVTAIDLSSMGLSGYVSPHVANVTFLTDFTIADNGFSGDIPPEFGNLQRLQVLDLSYNSLVGAIPINLTRCTSLTTLYLSCNSLSGTIPTELGLLSKLGFLGLANNSLTGEIPASIGNLSALYFLDLIINHLHGTIPGSLGSLRLVEFFQVSANELSGAVPDSLYNLSSLYKFGLAGNDLRGTLPPTLGTTLPNLQKLIIGGNRFQGPIPISLPNATRISYVELSISGLSGAVPRGIGRLSSLTYLNLENNLLESSGPDGWSFLESLANCSRLRMLSFYHNNLSGDLPRSVANLSTSLRELRLNLNRISGTVPSGIGSLVSLTVLALGPNLIGGPVPESIGMLTKLQLLTLYRSRFVGSVPSSIGNLTQLSYLYLTGNRFRGRLPSNLGNLLRLKELGLGSNGFTGTIPKELFDLPSLTTLGVPYNSLVGPIPPDVGNVHYLTELYLAGNELSGEIPGTLGGCQLLELVDLKHNLFQGRIPSAFAGLKGLLSLDLSRNNLSGPIPEFLESLSLEYLNLSFNEFQGEVPVKGIFLNATSTSLLGNDQLCGGIPAFRLPSCADAKSSEKTPHLLLKLVMIPIASAILCLFLLFVLMFAVRKIKRGSGTPVATNSTDGRYPRTSYSDLAKATDGFSDASLIGKGSYGSVYKGGEDIAVKVFDLRMQGASKSFLNECQVSRSLRHRNLVKILTSCSSVDSSGNEFKALVFELMPNGNLESWLHDRRVGRLSLTQRMNVAVGIADALEYLHFGCEEPVVHCDLKPSNVLLDFDMVAHVGDFGLARLVQEAPSSDSVSSSIVIRGTIGYVAPEYGGGVQVSTSGDVYSFGIVLLEMFTGMRPVSDEFKDGLSLRSFIDNAGFTGRITEVVDPLLFEEDGQHREEKSEIGVFSRGVIEERAVAMLRVGLWCSIASPGERPDVRVVAAELRRISGALPKELVFEWGEGD